jgi:hypothetical protein
MANIFYLVDERLPVRDKKGFLKITEEQLKNCISDRATYKVCLTLADAIQVENDGLKKGATKRHPIFKVEYESKGRETTFELEDGTVIAARLILGKSATLISGSLAHVDSSFKEVDLREIDEAEEKIESKSQAKTSPSRARRFLSGAATLARPSVLAGLAAGAGSYFLNGLSYVPNIISNFIGEAAKAVFPNRVPVDIAIGVTSGVAALVATETGQQVLSQANQRVVSPLWNYARSNKPAAPAVTTPAAEVAEVVKKKVAI